MFSVIIKTYIYMFSYYFQIDKNCGTPCWSLNLGWYKKEIAATTNQALTHTALHSGTNGPQWVGYKGGDVMSVMETVCPFASYPFLIQLSFLTQSREKERKNKERQKESVLLFFILYSTHLQPTSYLPLKCPLEKWSNLLLDLGHLNTQEADRCALMHPIYIVLHKRWSTFVSCQF